MTQLIQPYLIGYGRAGRAIHESLAILKAIEPRLKLADPILLKRTDPIRPSVPNSKSVLLVSNPHALHAKAIQEGSQNGFDGIATEKPVCVRKEEISKLKNIQIPVAVFHAYRQTWAPARLKQMLEQGELGELVSIEGKYWQSSIAERSLVPADQKSPTWKNDVNLSGPSDVLIDIGVHWIDMAAYVLGSLPKQFACDLSYANSESTHRDSHAWLQMQFEKNGKNVRSFASISKNIHGASNHFEINLLGTRKSATWFLSNPDEIQMGEGKKRYTLIREDSKLGSLHSPFHGAGWMEGYIEILRQWMLEVSGQAHTPYPTLREALSLMEMILNSELG
jgi:predicted dehydrogenase